MQWAVSARNFIVLQFGLSAFVPTNKGLEAVTYNFWLFPRRNGRRNSTFMCQVSPFLAVATLNSYLLGVHVPARVYE